MLLGCLGNPLLISMEISHASLVNDVYGKELSWWGFTLKWWLIAISLKAKAKLRKCELFDKTASWWSGK